MSLAEQYANDVLSGKVVAGRWIKKACQRFMSDLKRDDIYFDEVEATKIVNFAERYCCLWEDKWRGEPVSIKPWMAFFLQQIYGWFRKETGLRRVRKVYVQIAKKNAKSTLAGVVSIYHLFADTRVQTPKIFVGANNEDQAKICVNIAGKMIENSPELYELVADKEVDLFSYKENIVNIVHRSRDGFIKAMSKEAASTTSSAAGGKHGINPSLAIIDEYGMADSDSLLNTFESAQAARAEPLIFCITTAGSKKAGPCYTQLRKSGIDLLEGRATDDSYLPFIWEMDTDEEIKDPKNWPKSNPNINVSVFYDFLLARMNAAKNEGGSKEVDVKTYNFNIWCDVATVWVPTDKFRKNTHGIRKEDLEGAICFSGYDFSSRVDMCSVALIFPNFKLKGSKYLYPVLWWHWLPEERVKDNKERKDYTQWVDDGYIFTVPGDTIEWEYITEFCKQEFPKYQHVSGAYDPYLATNGTIQRLTQEGVTLNPIAQGFNTISEPTKEWEKLLINEQIEHFGNPLIEYMNANTTIIRDANRNIKIAKVDGNKGHLKIDGIAAAINALGQYMSGDFTVEDDEFINI